MERRTFLGAIVAAGAAPFRPMLSAATPAYAPLPEDLSTIARVLDDGGSKTPIRTLQVMAQYTVPGDSRVYDAEWAACVILDGDAELNAIKSKHLDNSMRCALQRGHWPGYLTTRHDGRLQTVAVTSMEWRRV